MIPKINKRSLGDRIRQILFGCNAIGFVFLLLAPPGWGANFSINPTSLDLSASIKSGAFSVINSGKEKLNCQIDVKEWSQDESGKDVYADTSDIIFFPRIMTVEPNEQRAIRIGIKIPAGLKEKAYRLFVQEIPSPKKETEAKGGDKMTAGLSIAIRYAAPIFVAPAKAQPAVSLERLDLSKGTLSAVVKNSGNIHVKLLNFAIKGKGPNGAEVFSKDIAGWYVLQGLSRRYEAAIPNDICRRLATIEVSAQAEKSTINGILNVDRKMCTR